MEPVLIANVAELVSLNFTISKPDWQTEFTKNLIWMNSVLSMVEENYTFLHTENNLISDNSKVIF